MSMNEHDPCPCPFTLQHHLRRRKTNLGESDAEVCQAHHQHSVDMVQPIVANFVSQNSQDLPLAHEWKQCVEKTNSPKAPKACAEGIAVRAASRAIDDIDIGAIVPQLVGQLQQRTS